VDGITSSPLKFLTRSDGGGDGCDEGHSDDDGCGKGNGSYNSHVMIIMMVVVEDAVMVMVA
jgi:hypothetical protein